MSLKDPMPYANNKQTVLFEGSEPAEDIYAQIISSPDFYPILVISGGSNDCTSDAFFRPSISTLRSLHPILDEVVALHNENPCGWWTPNLKRICAALSFSHSALAPQFPGNTRKLGEAVVRLTNLHFERGCQEHIVEYADAQSFSSRVIRFLATGDQEHMRLASVDMENVYSGNLPVQIQHCREVNDMLRKGGFERVGSRTNSSAALLS